MCNRMLYPRAPWNFPYDFSAWVLWYWTTSRLSKAFVLVEYDRIASPLRCFMFSTFDTAVRRKPITRSLERRREWSFRKRERHLRIRIGFANLLWEVDIRCAARRFMACKVARRTFTTDPLRSGSAESQTNEKSSAYSSNVNVSFDKPFSYSHHQYINEDNLQSARFSSSLGFLCRYYEYIWVWLPKALRHCKIRFMCPQNGQGFGLMGLTVARINLRSTLSSPSLCSWRFSPSRDLKH